MCCVEYVIILPENAPDCMILNPQIEKSPNRGRGTHSPGSVASLRTLAFVISYKILFLGSKYCFFPLRILFLLFEGWHLCLWSLILLWKVDISALEMSMHWVLFLMGRTVGSSRDTLELSHFLFSHRPCLPKTFCVGLAYFEQIVGRMY